jgi:hypothetical protein
VRAQLARRVYATLLHLYPAEFRRAYAKELTLLFADMHRTAAAQGALALARLWLAVLLDLLSSAIRERIRTMLNSKSATAISVALCLPFLFIYITAAYELMPEPAFMRELTTDGYRPSMLGYIVMLSMLLSLPVAFIINLLAMLTKAGSERVTSFTLTPDHTIIGMSILLVVLITFSQPVLYELRPFVRPLGLASVLGQLLFLLLLSALPAAFLLNRLPRPAKAGFGGGLTFRPTSTNLILGAAILLVILMLLSAFMLEATACSIGVPNCD